MDKNANNLDPKLKEAYDRIMGTNFAPASKPSPVSQQAQGAPLMKTEPVVQKTPVQPPAQEPPSPAQFSPTPEPPVSVFTQNGPISAQKKKLNLLPIFFVLGGIIFLGVYAVVWAKIFGLF